MTTVNLRRLSYAAYFGGLVGLLALNRTSPLGFGVWFLLFAFPLMLLWVQVLAYKAGTRELPGPSSVVVIAAITTLAVRVIPTEVPISTRLSFVVWMWIWAAFSIFGLPRVLAMRQDRSREGDNR